MGSSMLSQHTTADFQFDNYNAKICAYDGCRITLRYTNQKKHQVLNDRRYCSKACLDKQYQSLGMDGAVHLIHQTFGPEHPVTKSAQRMRRELAQLRKIVDLEDRRYIGKLKRNGALK